MYAIKMSVNHIKEHYCHAFGGYCVCFKTLCIIRPVVSALALTWFIRYIFLLKFRVPK